MKCGDVVLYKGTRVLIEDTSLLFDTYWITGKGIMQWVKGSELKEL